MITIREPFFPANFYENICSADRNILFFDIETTGLSREYHVIYLIGAAAKREGRWELLQWFAQSPSEEAKVIEAFLDFAKDYDTLIHFNGQRFDLPFTQARAEKLGIDYNLSFVESIDLMNLIKPYKELCGLDNCRQKTIENLLGIESREDVMTGGELIPVYYKYVEKRDNHDLGLLLLHNADDVRCMVDLTRVSRFQDFFHGPFRFEEALSTEDGFVFHFCSDIRLPHRCSLVKESFQLVSGGNRLSLMASFYCGELKYFYPDPKNYYYLPDEDLVVHKSVAQFVDKAHKKKCTKDNCYVKRQGTFLPQAMDTVKPAFKESCKDKHAWFLYEEDMPLEAEFCEAYLKEILSCIFKL